MQKFWLVHHSLIPFLCVNEQGWAKLTARSTFSVTLFLSRICVFHNTPKNSCLSQDLFSVYGWARSSPMREDIIICNVFSHWLRPCSAIDRKQDPALQIPFFCCVCTEVCVDAQWSVCEIPSGCLCDINVVGWVCHLGRWSCGMDK